MAQHFVTICFVCILCAASTCLAHTDLFSVVKHITPKEKYSTELPNYTDHFLDHRIDYTEIPKWNNINKKDSESKSNYKQSFNKVIDNSIEKSHDDDRIIEELDHIYVQQELHQKELLNRLEQNNLNSLKESKTNQEKKNNLRSKRSSEENEKYFTKKIFELYGDGENMTMEGFEKLLKKMGLFQSESKVSEQEIHSIDSNQSGSQLDSKKQLQNNNAVQGANRDLELKQRCLNSKELLSALSNDPSYVTANNNSKLPGWLFEHVCPALIYQLTAVSSAERGGCVRISESFKSSEIDQYEKEESTRNMFQVWVYSTVSILVISLCGLLGVAVIPVMGKSYYHQLLQFLVALAVGTLCGDALIHLLPHAMMSQLQHSHSHENSHTHLSIEQSDDDHNTNMWKGFVAMIGLVMFFFTEKTLNIISEWRKYNQSRKSNQIPPRVRVMREPDTDNTNTVGEKLCKHKYSTYPYCYGEIAAETQDNIHSHQHNHHERPQTIEEEKPLTCNSSNCNSVSNKIIQNDIEKKNEDWKMDDAVINDTKKTTDGSDVPLNESESYTVIIRDHEAKHHGHGHSHNHVHSTPKSMSSVAWMVLMGDGLHNFTDGMAIGAAFSANIAGGFSTTIAVFCHELPHELGDFAVLLKAGMSVKQAVFYNMLSSILCLFGMVFGVTLGATPSASSWMFAAAAGMFIYIALVDMIPELSSNHSVADGAHWQCLLQAAGLICGFGIMLIIALYEHDLQNIFSS